VDPALITALVGAGAAVIGAAVGGPLAAGLVGRRLRDAQATQAEAQADQLAAQVDQLQADVYARLTSDLRTDLDRVRAELVDARQMLAATRAEAEQLRTRVLDLEARLARAEHAEQRLAGDLAEVKGKRDRLREALAGKDSAIAELRAQVSTLTAQLTLARATPPA